MPLLAKRLKYSCPTCSDFQRDVLIAQCTGTFRDTTLTFRNLPVKRCANDAHPSCFVQESFGMSLERALLSHELTLSRSKFWRRNVCCRCSAPVTEVPTPLTVHADLLVGFQYRISVELTSPMASCAGCGQQQIFAGGNRLEDIFRASAAALDAVKLWP